MQTARTKDGRYVVKGTKDSTWTEVSKEVWTAARSSPLEGFGQGIKNRAQDILGGAMELIGGSGANTESPLSQMRRDQGQPMQESPELQAMEATGETIRRENDARQEALAQAQPVTSFLGAAVPEVATGGFGRGLKGAMAVDAALGAVSDPDSPALGAAISAGGGGVSYGTLKGLSMAKSIKLNAGISGRVGDAVTPVIDRAKNLPRTFGIRDTDAMRQGRSINASGTPNALGYDFEGAVRRGLPMTEGDYLVATARKGDRDALEVGDAMRKQEEISRSGLSPQGNTVNRIRDNQEQWLTDRLANEVGDSSLDRLTIDNIHPVRERIGDGFDEVLKRYDDDFQVTLTKQDIDKLKEAFDDVPEAAETPSFRKARDKVLEASEGNAISGKEFNVVRNTLNDTRDRLIGKGSTYDAGLSLDEAENILLARFRSQLEPEERALFDQLNSQWKIIKVLEGAARSTDAGGVANAATIRNTYRRLNPLAAKGYDTSDIWNDIKIADWVLNKANIPNSGTADRLLGNVVKGGLAAGAAAGGINLLGN